MERLSRLWNWILWMLFFLVGFYIVFTGGQRFWSGDLPDMIRSGKVSLQRVCQREFARCFYPGLFLEYAEGGDTSSLSGWYIERVMAMHPLCRLQYGAKQPGGTENASTYEMLVTGGVHDENELDETGSEYDMEALAQAENEKAVEERLEEERRASEEAGEAASAAEEPPAAVTAGMIYNMEELSDFDFLFGTFYSMDKTTTISPEDLNAEVLLSKDMSIDKEVEGPQILIYHTHSQEGFVDSVPGDNSTTIVLDESKLREALDNNPDEVAELFTRSSENGAASNGIMQGMKNQLDRYAGLTGATKGILVQQAGTPLNSLSLLDNEWQKQIDNITTQVEKWQDKLESQVDRYTSMFSKLEVLINQMNSQSSTLAGLMGGG